jgi:hypothetical protein
MTAMREHARIAKSKRLLFLPPFCRSFKIHLSINPFPSRGCPVLKEDGAAYPKTREELDHLDRQSALV